MLAVEGMHCASCGLLIDDELEDLPGVRSASTSVRTSRTSRTTVHLHADADLDAATLIAAVERAGDYRARPLD
jgi:copper chaperone CopZ